MRQKENYVYNKLQGNMFLARYNMAVEQLKEGGKIVETFEGAPKSRDYLLAECLLSKHRASKSYAYAWVAKKELLEKGIPEQEIDAYFQKYIDAPILRPEGYADIVDQDDQMPRFG